jgi:hypothetical protein
VRKREETFCFAARLSSTKQCRNVANKLAFQPAESVNATSNSLAEKRRVNRVDAAQSGETGGLMKPQALYLKVFSL